jgi:hypothetical protein
VFCCVSNAGEYQKDCGHEALTPSPYRDDRFHSTVPDRVGGPLALGIGVPSTFRGDATENKGLPL